MRKTGEGKEKPRGLGESQRGKIGTRSTIESSHTMYNCMQKNAN
jgi:hypothetical protein